MSEIPLRTSADDQALSTVIGHIKHSYALRTACALLGNYRDIIRRRDWFVQDHVLVPGQRASIEQQRQYGTIVYNAGRNSGQTFLAQMLCHQGTIVYAPNGPAEGFAYIRSTTGVADQLPDGLYQGVLQASVVTDHDDFIEALREGAFGSALIYGTRSLLDFDVTSPSAFLDEVASHLVGDLPSIHVIA